MTQLVDLVVDHRVLLNVHILARNVRLGLIIVVVGHEVVDRVLGEEGAELGADLRGKRLVRLENQRRAAAGGDDVRHRKGLARPGDAEQGLEREPLFNTVDQSRDRFRLIAGRRERTDQMKRGFFHSGSFPPRACPRTFDNR